MPPNLSRRERGEANGWLSDWPVRRPAGWADFVNTPQSEAEVAALRRCVAKGVPFGAAPWVAKTADRLGLESSLRERGRPRKQTEV